MKKFEVLVGYKDGEAVVEPGTIVELDEATATALLGSGNIKPVEETPVAQAGDVCTTEDGKEGKMEEVDGALVCVPTPAPAAPAEETSTASTAEEAVAPVEKKRHISGKLVISETERVVGEQTFHHIRLEDGSEMDLTEKEYQVEVHVTA